MEARERTGNDTHRALASSVTPGHGRPEARLACAHKHAGVPGQMLPAQMSTCRCLPVALIQRDWGAAACLSHSPAGLQCCCMPVPTPRRG
eukprot:365917-Chlamydomonas_euryale.AAC.18